MPYILSGMENSQPQFIAWRVAFFIPAFAQIIIGLAVLTFGQDLPDGGCLPAGTASIQPASLACHLRHCIALRCCPVPPTLPALAPTPPPCLTILAHPPAGNYAALRKAGKKDKAKTHLEMMAAIKNYRTWLMVLNYGYCFGVELTVDNNVGPYLYDNFNLSLHTAGEPVLAGACMHACVHGGHGRGLC